MPKAEDAAGIRCLMSEDCHRSAKNKDTFLRWLRKQPNYVDCKPTVEKVVREMTRRGGPLRSLVIQNQVKAAHKYWMAEAQYYLRHVHNVRYDVKIGKAIGKPVRMYIPVKFDTCGRVKDKDYIPIKRVADNPTLKFNVLEQAMAGFHAWLSRYEAETEFLKVFDPVIEAFREVEKELGSRDERSEEVG